MSSYALITGAAQRIGAVIARHLASEGYHLFLHYSSSQKHAEKLLADLCQHYPKQHFSLICQNFEQNTFEAFREGVGSTPLQILVHNASLFYPTPLTSLTSIQWDQLLQVNTKAPLFLTQALLPNLQQSENPAVIFIGDIHGEVTFPLRNYSAYGASKSALLYLVRELALELAPQIRVNAVCPGITIWPEEVSVQKQKNLIEQIPLKKRNDPEDLARAVLFLAQQTSITGVALPVDGGRLIARSDNRNREEIFLKKELESEK